MNAVSRTPDNITAMPAMRRTRKHAGLAREGAPYVPPPGSWVERIAEAIASPEIAIVSFDFFDTLVKRTVLRPADIFASLGIRLLATGVLPGHVSPAQFAQDRATAEAAARELAQRDGTPEIAIAAIYEQLGHLFASAQAQADAARGELEAERDAIIPNPPVAELLAQALRLNKLCVVCSDTYFSASDLQRFGHLPTAVRVFASSDHRTGKGGRLFDIMLDAMGCAAGSILHVGDNYAADVAAPGERGMRAMLVPNGTATSWEIMADERRMASRPACPEGAGSPQARVAGKLGSLRHSVLLGARHATELSHWGFGALVFGPIMFGYLRWLREQTRRRDCPMVVGLLREGATLADLYGALVGERPVAQLGISRTTLAKAALVQFSRAAFDSVVPARQGVALSRFARNFGLLTQDFPRTWRERLVTGQDPAFCTALFDHIEASPKLRAQLETCAAQVKARMTLHFHSVLGDGGQSGLANVALVDLGWGGTIQTGLRGLLDLPADTLLGLYLAINDTGLANARRGNAMAGYLFAGSGSGLFANPVLRSVEILEQAFTPPLGSVVDYAADGTPIHAADGVSHEQRRQAEEVRAGVLAFCRQAFADIGWEGQDGELLHAARVIASRFCLSPHEAERSLFAGWLHDDNAAAGALEPVTPAVFDHVAQFLTPGQLSSEAFTRTYWPSAVCAPDAVRMRDQALASLLAGADPDLATAPSGVAIRCRYGHEDFSGPQPALLNVFGRCAVTWRCEAMFGGELEFEFLAESRSLVAIEGLVLRDRIRRGDPGETMLIEAEELAAFRLGSADGTPNAIQLELDASGAGRLTLRHPAAGSGRAVDLTLLLRMWTGLPEAVGSGQGGGTFDLAAAFDTVVCLGRAQDAALTMRGWLLDQERWSGPSAARLVLEGADGRAEFTADVTPRPDVSRHFGRVLSGLPGVACRVSLQGKPLGRYRFGWSGQFGGRWATWMDPRLMHLGMGEDGVSVLLLEEQDTPVAMTALAEAAD